MPFKSKSQQRKFFADPELKDYARTWAKHTPNMKDLPEKQAIWGAVAAQAAKYAPKVLSGLNWVGAGTGAALGVVGVHDMVKGKMQANQAGQPGQPGQTGQEPQPQQSAAPAPQQPAQQPHPQQPAVHPLIQKYGPVKQGSLTEQLGKGLNRVGEFAKKAPGVTRFIEEGSTAAHAANVKRIAQMAEEVQHFHPAVDKALQHRRGTQLAGASLLAAPAAAYGAYRAGKALTSAPNKGQNTAEPLEEARLTGKEASAREQAFKVGFLFKLAEAGTTPDTLFEHLTKQADILDPLISGGVDAVKQMASGAGTGLKYLGGAALAAPVIAGGALGVGHGLLDAPNAKDLELMRKAELLGLYNRLSQDIKQRQIHRQLEA